MSTAVLRLKRPLPPTGACMRPGRNEQAQANVDYGGARDDAEEVEVDLPPHPPDPEQWACDSPLIWRISTDWLRRHGIRVPEGANLYVCWHRVWVD